MTRFSLLVAFVLLVLCSAARSEPVDTLVMVLQNEKGNVPHVIYLPKSANCPAVVAEFQRDAKAGKPVMVTIEIASPKLTGRVIAAYCVFPDGSMIGGILLPPT
jgi:hypothetical protein